MLIAPENPRSMCYTGVGGRVNVPKKILEFMREVGAVLALAGYTLRSGGADGCDKAFEDGCKIVHGKKKIYVAGDATSRAVHIAKQYHGAWHLCTDHAMRQHGRNVLQVLGDDLETPSDFLICWTRDGCRNHDDRSEKTGGTGTAISVASKNGVPIYNLKNKADLESVQISIGMIKRFYEHVHNLDGRA